MLHYLNDPRLWELWIFLMGNAGFISSTRSHKPIELIIKRPNELLTFKPV